MLLHYRVHVFHVKALEIYLHFATAKLRQISLLYCMYFSLLYVFQSRKSSLSEHGDTDGMPDGIFPNDDTSQQVRRPPQLTATLCFLQRGKNFLIIPLVLCFLF